MKAKINNVFNEEWIDLAARDSRRFVQTLKEIGLSKELVIKCKEDLDEANRKISRQNLIAKWNDPRYRSYRQKATDTSTRLDVDFFPDEFGFHHEFESEPTDEELRRFQRAMTGVAHYSDGQYGMRHTQLLVGALKRILGLIDLRAEGEQLEEVKIPLFKFQSPTVAGSEVVYEESQSEEQVNSYLLSVFGSGMGDTRHIFFSQANVLESRNGAYKLAYTPLTVRKILIGVYEKKRRVQEFLRTELFVKEESELDIGVDELSRDEFMQGIDPVATKGKFYRLSGDHTSSVHSFKEVLKVVQAFNWEVGISAFNLNTVCKAQISRTKEVKLEFKLPAGHDYQMKRIMNGLGVMWVEL